jgi:hypothetical protein
MVLRAIEENHDKEPNEWIKMFVRAQTKIAEDPGGKNVRNYNLGSELHTFPADASRELTIDNLTRRLEALQDW